MRNKETGEFELVVGNGFLVSVFFVVALLMAVAVSTGYILGKNSEKTAQAQQTTAAPCATGETRPQPSAQPVPTQTADSQPARSEDTSSRSSDPTPSTQPARQDSPTPTAPPAQPKDPPKPTQVAASTEVPTGFFWQVAASANMEAVHATLDTLTKAGFHAYLEPGPNNLTRVIVGPFSDTPSRAKAKTDLEGMSFKPYAHSR